jgi:hypothetical protein
VTVSKPVAQRPFLIVCVSLCGLSSSALSSAAAAGCCYKECFRNKVRNVLLTEPIQPYNHLSPSMKAFIIIILNIAGDHRATGSSSPNVEALDRLSGGHGPACAPATETDQAHQVGTRHFLAIGWIDRWVREHWPRSPSRHDQ